MASKFYDEVTGFDNKFWVQFDQPYRFGRWGRWVLKQLRQEVDENLPDEKLIIALVNRLSQGCYLLLLDNLETVLSDQECWKPYSKCFQILCDSSSDSRLLITSRVKLEGFEWYSENLDLKGLSISAAIDLLKAMSVQGTNADLQQFVTLTDGHPLLLKLAVGWLRREKGKRPNVRFIFDRQDLNLLEDIVGHHRCDPEAASVSKVLEQSVIQLPPSLQRLWQDLSVYRLPFGLRQAQAIQPEATLENLREFVRCTLLQEQPTEDSWEFSFLPLLQTFAQQRAVDQSEAHRRAINFYVETAKPKPWQTLEDIAAYLEIFHHHYKLSEYRAAFKVIYGCNKFLYTRSYNLTRIELYEPLVEKWKNSLDPKERDDMARALTCLGNANHALGKYRRAIECHQLCRDIFREIYDQVGESGALTHLGNAYQATGQLEQAIQSYQEALTIARNIGDSYAQANALGNMGNVYQALKQYLQAIDCHQQSLEMKQQLGKQYEYDAGYSLGGLGNAYQALGQYKQAIEYHQRWLEIAREIGDRRGESYSTGGLANAFQASGQYEQAIRYRKQALQLAIEVGDLQGKIYALVGLGDAYQSLEAYQQAIDFLQQALEITREIEDPLGQANTWLKLGMIFTKLQRINDALAAYTHAHVLFQTMGLQKEERECEEALEKMQAG
ncbi:MAG TPA: hypothetical protein DCL61_29990 [Cyanobacteria bacterium UBA12227]|nr:hypothetical protein [Cyanobacteria bacterium UBA12227]HAX88622.1 hypothetical protein [Cyanobacteria bacterium UBA11370]HBY77372.1 hypothetical protein [Cyanobacteria bacterium UBA11148]